MVRLQLRLILGGLAFVCAATARGAPSRTSQAANPLSPDRLRAVSARYLGVPYRRDCLGEGRPPDRDPLFTRARVDCQSFVEQVMAECLRDEMGGLGTAIRILRYRDGKVDLAGRHHFCLPDWLEHRWPARDVTARLGLGSLSTTRRRLSAAALLRRRGLRPGSGGPREVAVRFIPRVSAARRPGAIPDGSIVIFLSPRADQAAGHLGFVFQASKEATLRHASRVRHEVADEPLAAYLRGAGRRWPGIVVLRPDAGRLVPSVQ